MSAEVSFTKRAAAELSRCFNGLTVRGKGSAVTAGPGGVGGGVGGGGGGGMAPPGALLPATNGGLPSTANGGTVGGSVPSSKLTSAGQLTIRTAGEGSLSSVTGAVQERRKLSRGEKSFRVREFWAKLAKPTSCRELWSDPVFLERFFAYFPMTDRCGLAQVCKAWRDVLYATRFWRHLVIVLRCRELKSRVGGGDLSSTAELRKRLYRSLERRSFDGLCLFGASDDDIYDLVSNCPLPYLRQIRQISLRCCSVTDKGLETLMESLQGTSQLELAGCNELTDAGLWASLGPRIVSLSLSDCINVADESVAAIAQLLPSLYELNLQAYHVTDAALAFFGRRQSATLCVLRLRSCWELTNQGLLNLVHALPHLTVLSLSGCSKVSDDGVELIAENLKLLRSLDLSWCPRITDAALEYIACDLAQLEELTLDRCVHITDIGLGYLSTMVNLCALYLRWCSQIRDFGLQHLCSMRSLQILSLAGCPLLTCSSLSSLIQLRHLRELELTNCPGTSRELYDYLRENLPNCLIIE